MSLLIDTERTTRPREDLAFPCSYTTQFHYAVSSKNLCANTTLRETGMRIQLCIDEAM